MAEIQENGRTDTNSCRPKLPINWDDVEKLCMMHCTIEEICGWFGISWDTMKRACRENWDMTPTEKFAPWYEKGKATLRRKQWKLADTSAAMAIFLGKQLLKQSDDYNVNHKGDTQFHVVNYGTKEIKPWKEDARTGEEQQRD